MSSSYSSDNGDSVTWEEARRRMQELRDRIQARESFVAVEGGTEEEIERSMTLDEIITQCFQDSQAWFPEKAQDVPFLVLACMGELGEVANLVKKIERGTHTYSGPEGLREQLWEETIDVLIYLMGILAIWHRDGMDVAEEYQKKRAANLARFSRKADA